MCRVAEAKHMTHSSGCRATQELASGGDLWQLAGTFPSRRMPEAMVAVLVAHLLQALAYLHSQSIIHRREDRRAP